MRRRFALILALPLAACGSRSGLLGAAAGGSGGVAGAGGSAAGGTGGSGGSSGAVVCPALGWVGPALSVPLQGPEMDPLATSARAPRLVRTGPSDYAVVFESSQFHDSPSATLAAFTLHDPFGAWPPSAGTPAPIATEQSGFGASEGDPGLIAVAYVDDTGQHVLVEATPGGGNQVSYSWNGGLERVQFSSRNPKGEYLVGLGEKNLSAAWVKPPGISVNGGFACSNASLLAAAAPLAAGSWLMASSADASAECGTPNPPPKPPQNVSVQRYDGTKVLGSDTLPGASPVTALALAPKAQGAWLGYARNDESSSAFIYRVHAVDDLGKIAPEPATFVASTESAPGPEDYALTALGPSFALAAVTRDTIIPGGNFTLGVFYDFGFITLDGGSFGGMYFPDSAPSLIASDDGRSLLLVFVDGNDSHPVTMAVLRADCGLVH